MKIVIFGGTGFVGLNVAEALLARGHDVTLYDRAELPPSARRSLADYGARLKEVQGDITDTDAIDALIAGPSEDTLAAARDAWRAARPWYQETEASASATRSSTIGRAA